MPGHMTSISFRRNNNSTKGIRLLSTWIGIRANEHVIGQFWLSWLHSNLCCSSLEAEGKIGDLREEFWRTLHPNPTTFSNKAKVSNAGGHVGVPYVLWLNNGRADASADAATSVALTTGLIQIVCYYLLSAFDVYKNHRLAQSVAACRGPLLGVS